MECRGERTSQSPSWIFRTKGPSPRGGWCWRTWRRMWSFGSGSGLSSVRAPKSRSSEADIHWKRAGIWGIVLCKRRSDGRPWGPTPGTTRARQLAGEHGRSVMGVSDRKCPIGVMVLDGQSVGYPLRTSFSPSYSTSSLTSPVRGRLESRDFDTDGYIQAGQVRRIAISQKCPCQTRI